MKQQLLARWNAFSSKEKRILSALGLVLAGLLFYAFVWQPVQHDRQRLLLIIPEKQAKLALMRSQAADIERLRGQYKALNTNAGALKAAIAVSAKFHGLAPNYKDIYKNNNFEKHNDRQISLTLTQLSFDAWVKWIESLQGQHHVRVQSCRITTEGALGQVRVEAVFAAVE